MNKSLQKCNDFSSAKTMKDSNDKNVTKTIKHFSQVKD